MNCPACGEEGRVGANFCRRCGAPLHPAQPQLLEEIRAGAEPEHEAPGPRVQSAEPLTALPAGATEAPVGPQAEPETSTESDASATLEGTPSEQALEPAPEPAVRPEGANGSITLPPVAEPPVKPLAGLPPGTIVAGRYALIEASRIEPSEILYSVRDLCRCWQCGSVGNAPDDAFCLECGVAMDRRPVGRLLQVKDAEAEPAGGEAAAERLTQDGLFFVALSDARAPEKPPTTGEILRLIAGQRSDCGRNRELNEDSLLAMTWIQASESEVRPVIGMYAVADGMGGHEGGEVASRMALQVMAGHVVRTVLLPESAGDSLSEQDLLAALTRAVELANDAVFLARSKRQSDMGTTLTVAVIRGDRLVLAHVGDGRAYRWDSGGLTQLTTDHSMIASMVASGHAAPEDVYTHPHRSLVSRCIGCAPTVQVDASALPLASGDRLVLCSDGLWEMLRPEGIADVLMLETDPQRACDLLVQRANAAGGDDNISVIVVHAQPYLEELHAQ